MATSFTATQADGLDEPPSRGGGMLRAALKPVLLPFAGSLALLLASLVNFLVFNDYPLLRGDVLLVAGGFTATCAFVAWLYSGQRSLVQAAMEAVLIALVVDLNSNQEIVAIGAGMATLLFVFFARKSILPFASIIGASIIVTSLLGLGTRQPWIETRHSSAKPPSAAPALPAIVHIILDEHIGVEGLPKTNPETRAIKAELRSFYESRGFALFGRAYSEHMHTVNAIPDILNYGNRGGFGANPAGVRVGSTAHLERLRKQGYRLHLFQSNFADFCTDARAEACTTYIHASLHPTLQVPLSASARASLVIVKFAALSSFAKRLDRADLIERNSLTSSVAALSAAPRFAEQVRRARPGEVHLAHLLVPHYPYVADRACRLLPTSQWHRRRGTVPLDKRETAYFEQLRCTMRQVDRILEAVAQSPAGQDAIVVIHGDHGSRITRLDPNVAHRGHFSKADLIAGFTTLFAVRSPRIAPGYHESPARVSRLLKHVAQSDFSALPPEKSEPAPSVVLDDWSWRPRSRVPFPTTW